MQGRPTAGVASERLAARFKEIRPVSLPRGKMTQGLIDPPRWGRGHRRSVWPSWHRRNRETARSWRVMRVLCAYVGCTCHYVTSCDIQYGGGVRGFKGSIGMEKYIPKEYISPSGAFFSGFSGTFAYEFAPSSWKKRGLGFADEMRTTP